MSCARSLSGEYTDHDELAGISDTLRGEISYGYDAEGRLMSHSEARQGYRAQFCYDAADNLVTAAQSPPVSDNRLMHWQNLFMQYDGWGNLVSRRHGLYQQHFVYDAENRLISASGTGPLGDFTARYHYDALGRRTSKIVTSPHGSQETRFLWQGYRLLQEQHNGLCSTYLYDPDEAWSPLARVEHTPQQQRGDLLWFSTDLNGAPLEVTDEEGDVCWSGQHGSFGAVSGQTDGYQRLMPHPALRHQPLRYAGQYADAETGLHYNLFRYYDPQVGRFITPDPIGLAGGLNLYAYAPNPLSWIDPLGLAKGACGGTPRDAQKKVNKEQGPKEIKRIDEPEPGVPGSQWHAHQTKAEKGRHPALNQNGSTHDGPPSFSKKTLKWLKDHGWNVEDWL